MLINVEPVECASKMTRYRVRYEKKGLVKYVSHLDLINYFSRLVSRCNIDIEYTQGFNRKPKFEFGPALQLGIESDCEYFNMFVNSEIDPQETMDKLNEFGLEELKILEVKPGLERKISKTVDGFLFEVIIKSMEEDVELDFNIRESVDYAFLVDEKIVKPEFVDKFEFLEDTDKTIRFLWRTKFLKGAFISPKRIERLDDFKDVYVDYKKIENYWIDGAN